MSTADTVNKDRGLASKLLETARLAMAEGRDFDLVEFNDALSSACHGVVDMPQEKRSKVREALSALLSRLDDFKRELEQSMARDTRPAGSGSD